MLQLHWVALGFRFRLKINNYSLFTCSGFIQFTFYKIVVIAHKEVNSMITFERLTRSNIIKSIAFSSLLSGIVIVPSTAFALHQEPIAPINNIDVAFSQAELDQILAPIALYPDTLLTHILIASTYPIEVVEASRFTEKYENDSQQSIINRTERKNWDPSVKALVAFPRVLKNLSNDLNWMTKLGDAFLQDESLVLASIQVLRQKADEAGNLSQMDNVEIVREKKTIIIEPAEPEVIYVPYYDTRVVYGNWHWSHNPPIYWRRPVHYAYYHGPFYWQPSVHIGFDFFFSAFHWRNHHVVRHHHKQRYYHSSKRIATSHHAKRWNHNPEHRKGVAYRSQKVKHRYNSKRASSESDYKVRKQHQSVIARHKSTHSNALSLSKKHINTHKHQQVSKRLQASAKKRVKSTSYKNVDKHYAKGKIKAGDRFKSAPGRLYNKPANKHQNVNTKVAVSKHEKKVYARDTWKKQPRVEPLKKVKTTYKQKSYKSSNSNKPTYKKESRKGGHSSKQYARVSKNSSNRVKSHGSKSRQKHR